MTAEVFKDDDERWKLAPRLCVSGIALAVYMECSSLLVRHKDAGKMCAQLRTGKAIVQNC